ncbi:hypothetical protein BA011_34960 (plasmid) [Rhizobium leguminosarum]|uniref:Uncharacterized protein n=1 Tax=Rhizobium leguminosarum TaxID=384 RepID=A0A1B1CMT2_RHILE|nr:hypothetical protein BA011_34960 [Rhizobium leguminosarum]
MGTIIDEDEGGLLVVSPLFGEKERGDRSLEKGRLIHRMLQALPEIPLGERPDAASRYAERAARLWPEAERRKLVDSVLKLLAKRVCRLSSVRRPSPRSRSWEH